MTPYRPYFLTFAALVFVASSCTSLSSPREDRHKTELSLHKIRTEVEDLKHDLNTSDIELHILEGKLIDQEETIVALKQQLVDSHQGKIQDLEQILQQFNKKVGLLEKKQDEILSDLRQLGSHANETTTALSQYKDKISEIEKNILSQNRKFEDLSKIKKTLETLSEHSKGETLHYIIKEGDSLQKISKQFNISIEEIKKQNHLKDDMIFTGQTLLIPKSY